MARKRTDVVKLQLRLLEGLRRRLEQAAADNTHSMNTEIIARLEASFRREDVAAQQEELARKSAQQTMAAVIGNEAFRKFMAMNLEPDDVDKILKAADIPVIRLPADEPIKPEDEQS